ncbi:hypothetical protein D917_05886, partial [Trichinella nativa]
CWLEKQKPISKQISSAKSDQCFDLIVKFYTANPVDLEEEYTRYLFALQIKRDLASGELVCNENTAAVMASYIVQCKQPIILIMHIIHSFVLALFLVFIVRQLSNMTARILKHLRIVRLHYLRRVLANGAGCPFGMIHNAAICHVAVL